MMRYVTSCIDEKTGRELVLSDASYNVALDWLQREAEKYGKEIFRTENNGTDDMWIYVGIPKKDVNPMTGEVDVWYTNQVVFHYDEERGVLTQE